MNTKPIYLSFVPHGINPKYYHPIEVGHKDYDDFQNFEQNFKTKNDVSFIVFWNNRNIRRKQSGDLVLAFRKFCDGLPKDKASKVCLLMHTEPIDENGTDLISLKNTLCNDYKVIFSDKKLSVRELNFLYNLVDVTVNIASNEGFGLSSAESMMAGTPIINNVTGGLQDQCRFEDATGSWINFDSQISSNHNKTYSTHGSWVKPVFPTNRSLQGSVPTPYIFDDRCSFEDVADALKYWYDMSKEDRKKFGKMGREWALSEESGMSSTEMSKRFVNCIDKLLDVWEPKDSFIISKSKNTITNSSKNIGITW
jgi:glycosyltransferase involved in cell wall biosynthesis